MLCISHKSAVSLLGLDDNCVEHERWKIQPFRFLEYFISADPLNNDILLGKLSNFTVIATVSGIKKQQHTQCT